MLLCVVGYLSDLFNLHVSLSVLGAITSVQQRLKLYTRGMAG